MTNNQIKNVEGIAPVASQDQLVSFYANSQIWYDSLSSAFDLAKSGKDIYWAQLLSNIGLGRLVNQ